MWSTGEGNGKPLQYYCLENPMNHMKRHDPERHDKDMALKDKLLRSVGAQYAAGEIAPVENKSKEEWINNSRKNEEMEQK